MSNIETETRQRRTFAIISHPDAGKTTLTEKLLLYSGMIRTAGMVRGRKGSRAASSDWMAMEQERGISITASAMQFRYKDAIINVLDTPGHQDFSEDTYRTLTAADSAVMVIDAARGVEAQTRKLFSVCRMRGIPILTFINKMDLPGKEPLELLQEVEEVLGIKASPLNWPIGSGKEFVGVSSCVNDEVLLFSKVSAGGAEQAKVRQVSRGDIGLGSTEIAISDSTVKQFLEEFELLQVAGNSFSEPTFLRGEVTPVFFGSALTNFGVEPFFDNFIRLAPSPRPVVAFRALQGSTTKQSSTTKQGSTTKGDGGSGERANNGAAPGAAPPEEILIDPVTSPFSGFVFKIQANMNPRHRDSMAFIRVCSGVFEREMMILHHRSGKEVRLSRSHSMLAQERTTLETAFPGDVIGVTNPGLFSIGDTISVTGGFNFKPMPQFPPEVIAQLRPLDMTKRKAFDKGMQQLAEEGTMQVLFPYANPAGEPYIAAVGRLQFEVLQFRLQEEYGVPTKLENMPHQFGAWLVGDPATFRKPSGAIMAIDRRSRVIVLFANQWEKNYALEQNPQHGFVDLSE